MQNFDISYDEVIGRIEGGYSFDKDDSGGETYRGITRNYHPEWSGWPIIDLAKRSKDFPKNLDANMGLQGMVREFYKKEFWDVFKGDALKIELSKELFDIAVNCSPKIAVALLQRTINIMNNNGSLYTDINVDGSMGNQTMTAIDSCIKTRSLSLLVNILNLFQAKYYIDIMERKSKDEKYIGWFKRINLIVDRGNE